MSGVSYADTLPLLERFWHPICLQKDTEKMGTVKVCRFLSRELAVVRALSGKLFAVDNQCSHRGVSLEFGQVGQNDIACPYHGWTFDVEGKCISRPFEGSSPRTCDIVGYPIEERYGLVFAYFGKGEPPVLPKFDVLDECGLSLIARYHRPIAANWLSLQDNAVDVSHTHFLHGQMNLRVTGHDRTGFYLNLKSFGFLPTDFGIVKSWSYQ